MAFFTADHAVIENGKAYINGGFWNRIFRPSFPTQISISLVASIKVPAEAYLQDHTFAVEMLDAGGKELGVKIGGEFRVAGGPDLSPGEPTIMALAIPLEGVSLSQAGDYTLILSIDGNEIARYGIRAVQVGVVVQQPSSQIPGGNVSDSQEEE